MTKHKCYCTASTIITYRCTFKKNLHTYIFISLSNQLVIHTIHAICILNQGMTIWIRKTGKRVGFPTQTVSLFIMWLNLYVLITCATLTLQIKLTLHKQKCIECMILTNIHYPLQFGVCKFFNTERSLLCSSSLHLFD